MLYTDRNQYRNTSGAVRLLFLTLVFLWPYTAHAADSAKHGFRLGTAAMPFGWSTAIADFDSDHKPDYAIANKIGISSRGYEYSLELELSLEARQVFRFHSSYPGLSVTTVDLDNDHDLDVVLTRIGNGEVVGVWINDGHGQFSEGTTENTVPVPFSLSANQLRRRTGVLFAAATNLRRLLFATRNQSLTGVWQLELVEFLLPIHQQYSAIAARPTLSTRAPPVSFVF